MARREQLGRQKLRTVAPQCRAVGRVRAQSLEVESEDGMKSNLIDIAGCLHAETEKAILFSDTAMREDAVWLPKSQIEFEHDGGRVDFVTVTLPERLAQEKGLI